MLLLLLHGCAALRVANLVRMQDSPHNTPLEDDALSLLFPTPILRVNLGDALPEGTLKGLQSAVLKSWDEYSEEHRASSAMEQNEDFFRFQKRAYGVLGHCSDANPQGWMASESAQELIGAVAATASGYLERVAHHARLDVGRPWSAEDWEIDPDKLHIWASVHQGGSNHPRHIHVGAVLSAVFYVAAPPGAGSICFSDPRGDM